jgi:hypothetical protein
LRAKNISRSRGMKMKNGQGKNLKRLILGVGFLIVFFYVMFPRPVYAYLDMGTGSYVIQVVIASLFGVIVTLKVYWKKIKAYLASALKKKKPE